MSSASDSMSEPISSSVPHPGHHLFFLFLYAKSHLQRGCLWRSGLTVSSFLALRAVAYAASLPVAREFSSVLETVHMRLQEHQRFWQTFPAADFQARSSVWVVSLQAAMNCNESTTGGEFRLGESIVSKWPTIRTEAGPRSRGGQRGRVASSTGNPFTGNFTAPVQLPSGA